MYLIIPEKCSVLLVPDVLYQTSGDNHSNNQLAVQAASATGGKKAAINRQCQSSKTGRDRKNSRYKFQAATTATASSSGGGSVGNNAANGDSECNFINCRKIKRQQSTKLQWRLS